MGHLETEAYGWQPTGDEFPVFCRRKLLKQPLSVSNADITRIGEMIEAGEPAALFTDTETETETDTNKDKAETNPSSCSDTDVSKIGKGGDCVFNPKP